MMRAEEISSSRLEEPSESCIRIFELDAKACDEAQQRAAEGNCSRKNPFL
jgi:hypothetical protein